MPDSTFDPKTVFETYRNAFAPVLKVQQEGVKAAEVAGRFQYALAGDLLEWSVAQAKVAVGVQTPAEFASRQVELATAFSEKLQARAKEFMALSSDATAKVTEAVAAAGTKQAA